jgi:protein TonB
MNPDPIDILMEDVLREVANPAPSADFETRTTQRSLTMNAATATPSNNLLIFSSLDRTGGRRMSPQSVGIATLLNIAAVLLLMVQVRAHMLTTPPVTMTMLSDLVPPPAPPKLQTMGGGGGQKGPTPVSKGSIPPPSPVQLNPPKTKVDDAKLTPPTTVNLDMKMADNHMPNFGMPNSPNVGTSMGNGNGTGIGSGNGNGVGPGMGSGMGGGIHRIGGGVMAPVVLYAPEPEFSEEARKAKVSGNVLVYLQVDTNGHPMNVRVLRGIGMGLDQKAIDAVSHYKFKPATENGKPVAVEMQVDVNFQIF